MNTKNVISLENFDKILKEKELSLKLTYKNENKQYYSLFDKNGKIFVLVKAVLDKLGIIDSNKCNTTFEGQMNIPIQNAISDIPIELFGDFQYNEKSGTYNKTCCYSKVNECPYLSTSIQNNNGNLTGSYKMNNEEIKTLSELYKAGTFHSKFRGILSPRIVVNNKKNTASFEWKLISASFKKEKQNFNEWLDYDTDEEI